MSVHADIAMDQAYHPEPPPTEAERVLVQAFRFGQIDLPTLYKKLGLRALAVCAHAGIYSRTPALQPTTVALDLSGVPTPELLAELDRRSAG